MVAVRELSEDSRALLLCTGLALGRDSAALELTPSEWRELSTKIDGSSLESISQLLGLSSAELELSLGVESAFSQRLAMLLGDAIQLDGPLSRLESIGITVTTLFENDYPSRLKEKLGTRAPLVLYVAGTLPTGPRTAVGIVGSRDVNERGRAFAHRLGQECAQARVQVVSGAARGVDQVSMNACLELGGSAVGIVADGLERAIVNPEIRSAIETGSLALVSPYLPSAHFSIANAMNRNKVIYALADYSIVVDSALQKGGTWQGAQEALRHRWSPVFVRSGEECGAGNSELIRRGGIALTWDQVTSGRNLKETLQVILASHESACATGSDLGSQIPNSDELASFLKEARSIDEIARMLKLTLKETKLIIDEEIENGRVSIVRKRPLLYMSTNANGGTMGDLFDTSKNMD